MLHLISPARLMVCACLTFTSISPDVVGARPSGAPPPVQTEVQIGLCGPPDQITRALKLHPRASRDEWLFDDAALTLFERGLRFRLRVANGSSELTLKVAKQDCAQLAPSLVPSGEGKCEYDLHGTSIAGAVSLNRSVSANATRDLLAGGLPLAEALSAAQIRYLRDVVGAWPLPAGIRALGPLRVVSYGAKDKPFGVEVSQPPSGGTYVEISRKVSTLDAMPIRDALVDELARAGVAICADQSAQTLDKLRALQR
jgi:hypothetical protein